MSLVSVTKISSLMLASVAEQTSLSLAWSETPENIFSHDETQLCKCNKNYTDVSVLSSIRFRHTKPNTLKYYTFYIIKYGQVKLLLLHSVLQLYKTFTDFKKIDSVLFTCMCRWVPVFMQISAFRNTCTIGFPAGSCFVLSKVTCSPYGINRMD